MQKENDESNNVGPPDNREKVTIGRDCEDERIKGIP